MNENRKIATIFGGTGFVGRHVVRRLAKAGYTVKVATRVTERAYFLRPFGTPGQVVPFGCDYNDPQSIAAAVAGAETVINCIAILHEKKKNGFEKIHVDLPREIAKSCAAAGVKNFVHISALGIEQSASRYAATKLAGEQAIRQEFPAAVILRPSVIFGPEDNFFNMFAELARYMPALPLIGGGWTKFQPVYVGDVADAVMAAIVLPQARGNTYELGGPDIVTFREIYDLLSSCTGRKRMTVSLPFGLAKIKAAFLELLPSPLLTRDQVESLKTDNVVVPGSLGLRDLGINPSAMALILPGYLGRFRSGGAFADKKRA